MFIQFLAEHGNRVAKAEKKPRRNIQYADICNSPFLTLPLTRAQLNFTANAVHRLRQTEFLMDVVPRTVPYKKIVERKAKEAKEAAQAVPENGPAITNSVTNGASGEATTGLVENGEDPNAQLEREMQSQKAAAGPSEKTNGHHEDEDVEMAE